MEQDFRADDATLEEFYAFLDEEEIPYDRAALDEYRDRVALRIDAEVFSLLWGPGPARGATLDRDPQIRAALGAMPRAALLLNDPEAFLAGASGSE